MSEVKTAAGAEVHFVLVPLTAPGHMIPMVDLAKLLSARGVMVTIVTTPSNASRFRAPLAGELRITVAAIPFPSSDAGLPEGSESFESLLPSQFIHVFHGTHRMLGPVESYLRRCPLHPTCIISDSCQPWAAALAANLGVPRISFWCVPFFALLAWYNMEQEGVYGGAGNGDELFVIPGISPEMLATRSQVPPLFLGEEWVEFREEFFHAESTADGVIVNTFHALEPMYINQYKSTAAAAGKRKVWAAGPFLASNSPESLSKRGNTAVNDVTRCLAWLDSKPAASVVYVCFGSISRLTAAQLIETSAGLELSGMNFLWVVKDQERSPDLEGFLAGDETFEERVAGRGMVVLGWAPQLVILSHAAVGGFLTHCGWNSTLEALSAGVAMAAWPFFGDQFLNTRLLVDVLRVAVDVGVAGPSVFGFAECLVGREAVRAAVVALMDRDGEEGRWRRERVMALKEEARKAMESGGVFPSGSQPHDSLGCYRRRRRVIFRRATNLN